MKITLDLSDTTQLAEILDAIVGAHLKSSRRQIIDWHSTHPDDVEYDTKVIESLNVVIEYFTGDDDETT
jgi:endo-1,4-beta-mannosidase